MSEDEKTWICYNCSDKNGKMFCYCGVSNRNFPDIAIVNIKFSQKGMKKTFWLTANEFGNEVLTILKSDPKFSEELRGLSFENMLKHIGATYDIITIN